MADQPLILIVDDEEMFREIFSQKLSSAGYRTQTASGGAEGIKMAAEIKPDLILMDMMMPEMDGATTALKLKEDPATKDIKLAFLTSLGDPRLDMGAESDQQFSQSFGAQAYFKKTDDLDALVEGVKGLLAK